MVQQAQVYERRARMQATIGNFEDFIATDLVGYVDGQFSAPLDIGTVHAQRLRIFGVSNKNRTPAERTASVADFTQRFLPRMAERKLTPLIDRVFDFDQLPAAREHMQADRHIGKVVLQVG